MRLYLGQRKRKIASLLAVYRARQIKASQEPTAQLLQLTLVG